MGCKPKLLSSSLLNLVTDNRIGAPGSKVICDILLQNKVLEELDLHSKFLHLDLAHVLSLVDNEMGDLGVRFLCKALLENRTVRKINLKG